MRISQAGSLIKQAAKDWLKDRSPQLGAALAYYSIFSIAPLLIIAISVASIFLGEKAARGQVLHQASSYVGETGGKAVESMVLSARKSSGNGILPSIISIVVLLFGATGVFGQLQSALNQVWNAPAKKGGGIWRLVKDRGIAFLMVLLIGALLLASMVVSAVLTGFMNYAANVLPGRWVLLHLADFGATVFITSFLFAAIYRILPDVEISWRDVWVGAITTAVLFALGKIGIGFYLGRGSVASSYGLAGSVIVLLLWIYYSSLILFFGAELTQAYARICGSHLGVDKDSPAFVRKLKGDAEQFELPDHLKNSGLHADSGKGAAMDEGKKKAHHEQAHGHPHIASESEYLANEAALARAAIQATVRELSDCVGQAANPAIWTRRYPWAAVGIAAAAGVVAGNFIPIPDQRTRHEMKRAWRQHRRVSSREQRAREALLSELEKARGNERGVLGKLSGPVQRAIVRMLKTTLKSGIMAALSAGAGTAAAKGSVEQEPTVS